MTTRRAFLASLLIAAPAASRLKPSRHLAKPMVKIALDTREFDAALAKCREAMDKFSAAQIVTMAQSIRVEIL